VANDKLDALRKKLRVQPTDVLEPVKSLSTGIVAFDEVMGGGLPEGKVVELFGDFASGKSLLVYHALKRLQAEGGLGVLVDTEDALNFAWAKALGLDVDKLIYVSPVTSGEELTIEYVFKLLEDFVRSVEADEKLKKTPCIFAWDSVAATKSAEEGEELIYKPEMASRARVIGQLIRKIPTLIAGTRISFVLVNQLRDKPGVMYGAKEDTPGGRAIKFHAHLRLLMKKGQKVKDEDAVTGMNGTLFVEKSKVSRPFRQVNFQLSFDSGIDKFSGLQDLLIREGVVEAEKAGWCKLNKLKFRRLDEAIWDKIKRIRAGEDIGGDLPEEDSK